MDLLVVRGEGVVLILLSHLNRHAKKVEYSLVVWLAQLVYKSDPFLASLSFSINWIQLRRLLLIFFLQRWILNSNG